MLTVWKFLTDASLNVPLKPVGWILKCLYGTKKIKILKLEKTKKSQDNSFADLIYRFTLTFGIKHGYTLVICVFSLLCSNAKLKAKPEELKAMRIKGL